MPTTSDAFYDAIRFKVLSGVVLALPMKNDTQSTGMHTSDEPTSSEPKEFDS